jgi:hypothetical protein
MNGHDACTFCSANELREAVLNKFLTQEEARLVYWAQFSTLRQRAATTPPEQLSK